MSDNESVSNILSDALATVDASVPTVKPTAKPRKVPKTKTAKPVAPPVAEPVEPTPTAPATMAEAEAFAEHLAETIRASALPGTTINVKTEIVPVDDDGNRLVPETDYVAKYWEAERTITALRAEIAELKAGVPVVPTPTAPAVKERKTKGKVLGDNECLRYDTDGNKAVVCWYIDPKAENLAGQQLLGVPSHSTKDATTKALKSIGYFTMCASNKAVSYNGTEYPIAGNNVRIIVAGEPTTVRLYRIIRNA